MKSLLKLLLPPVSYGTDAPVLDAELQAEANQLTKAQNRLDGTERDHSVFANALLADWERLLGLATDYSQTYQQRLEMVLFKLSETGGLSIPYFIHLAERMGYRITIDELQPFRTGSNRVGEPLWVKEIIWVWRVNVHGSKTRAYRFRTGVSAVGDRLSTFADPVIEALFQELKPAHTYCYFTYQEA
ncbi:phage tail protein [Morganella morganii]|uniref:Phage tail protein n=1 Tax=Morganella morganii TaxID=582 RepID=A0A0D8L5K8_MORMO|nr:phage tail protein [Morganella morganii]